MNNTEILKTQFPFSKELLKIKSAILDDADDARLVGGCVRDFLAKKPIKDIDIATKYTPEQVTQTLEKAGIKTVPTGIKHGTITAVVNKKTFEITTLRKDLSCDGRHAEVEFSKDYEEDAKRRDFTINAMYIDFDGNLYDYFGGAEDLKKGIIKFIGNPDDRIKEDYLRILRLFRFYCYYGKTVNEKSLNACKINKEGLKILSDERISAELLKILNAQNPTNALVTMQNYGILQIIFNKELDLSSLVKLIALEKTLKINTSAIFRLGLLLLKEDLQYVKNIAKKLKLSNSEKKQLLSYNKPIDVNQTVSLDKLKELMLDYSEDYIIESLLVNLLKQTKNEDKAIKEDFDSIKKFLGTYKIPKLPINGDDLINAGIAKGPKMALLLKNAKKYWIKSSYKAGKNEILKHII